MVKTRLAAMTSIAVASALLFGGTAIAAEHRLGMDQVRVISFKRPFSTVSVGNALIAEATVIDETHVFITGREFGTTNIIAVDDEGNVIADEMISVTTSQGTMLTVTRGGWGYTVSCRFDRCDMKPTPGDDPQVYDPIMRGIILRENQSEDAATPP